jgi:hypothetical protein
MNADANPDNKRYPLDFINLRLIADDIELMKASAQRAKHFHLASRYMSQILS